MTEETNKEPKISRFEYFFEKPLYEPIELVDLEDGFNQFFSGDVDAYNPVGFDTTYNINKQSLEFHINSSYKGYYIVVLTCRRKGVTLEFFVYKTDTAVIKVGQYLSLADLQYAEIGKKYNAVLSKNDLHDLKKAIGLVSHGAGAGSLVYLRRIFENIIRNTFDKHKSDLNIPDEVFMKKRMDEKVDCLKAYLPSQLVEMRAVYGILSKGVHELKEEECLAFFPALKLSIILILDQQIEDEAKKKKNGAVKKAISDIANQINRKIV